MSVYWQVLATYIFSIFILVNTATPEDEVADDATVVTAYFNIGSFAKCYESNQFTPNLYYKWMKVFSRLKSPLVAYFDNDADLEVFSRERQKLPSNLTILHKVDRNTVINRKVMLWYRCHYSNVSHFDRSILA